MTASPAPASASLRPTTNTPVVGAPLKPVFDWVLVVASLAVVAVFVRAMLFTPIEINQGPSQKIFYVHLPSALMAYLCFTIVALMSLVYLWLKDERADRLAEAAGEVAIVFTTAVLVTGPLWGKPVWGAWWVWEDMRLTLTLFLWFLGVGYLILRGIIDDPGMRARYSAVLGVLAALLIPFIHLSVYMFRSQHPAPVVLKPDRPSMPGEMLLTLVLAFCAFTFLCIALIRARYRYALQREALAELEAAR